MDVVARKSRKNFISLAAGAAGFGLLVDCSGGALRPPLRDGPAIDSPQYQRLMTRQGICAVSDPHRVLAVRNDLKSVGTFRNHLIGLDQIRSRRGVLYEAVAQGDPGAGSGGTGLSGCTTVGAICDGFTLVGTVNSTSGRGAFYCFSSGGFDTFIASVEDAFSPAYTVLSNTANCLAADLANAKADMKRLAEYIVGGAAGAYFSSGSIAAVIGSANGFLAGTVSVWGFWDVVVVAATAVSLPELLGAVGIAFAVGAIFELGSCVSFDG